MRLFIQFSYNGKNYHGWQKQPNALTVQEVLNGSLSTLLRTEIETMGAGRTDTGVHASQMFAHFDFDAKMPDDIVFKLNSILPNDIAVENVFEVKDSAHARFDALSRNYKYRISVKKNVFNVDSAFSLFKPLDIAKMQNACEILLKYKDFQCFSKSNTDVKTYNCRIIKAKWLKQNDEMIFEIKADRFLRNMVRAIVGTMVEIGMAKISEVDLHHIIKSKDRRKAGFSVPAHGLYLTEIEYPETIMKTRAQK